MSARRTIRLRRDYLYRKSLEGKDKEDYEKKERIRRAIKAGKPIPTELREFAGAVKEEMDAEDEATRVARRAVDDEYAMSGKRDPKVCVTTARAPSARLKQFAKEIKLLFPHAQRINRGNTTTKEVVDACRSADFTDMIVLQETRGEPDALIVCHLPFGPTAWFTLSNTVMRHDIADRGTVSEAAPHLIFENFSSPIGERLVTILKHLFPVPRDESRRVMTFVNRDDTVSFRHHTYRKVKVTGPVSSNDDDQDSDDEKPKKTESDPVVERTEGGKFSVELSEVGPRFEMTPFQIKLGTIDQPEAETEWVLRPYMRTASRRKAL